MTETGKVADLDLIRRLIPHRYPFLLVDRVEEIEGTSRCVGIKNVTANEPHFQGHFPQQAVMPGVLVVEAMAQAAAVMVSLGQGLADTGALVYFMGMDNVKFRRRVGPGDVLRLEVVTKRAGGKVWKFTGRATVGQELAAEAEFSAMIARPEG